MKKDSHIIEIFNLLDDKESTVNLIDGRELMIWNIAWGCDDSNEFAHITSNSSPTKEGTTIDFFFSNEIKSISNNGNQLFSIHEKLKPINLIFLRTDKLLVTKRKYYHWRQIQSQFDDFMASLDFDSIESLIEHLIIEYQLPKESIIKALEEKQWDENETIELEIK